MQTRFNREERTRDYKKLFLIAVEGEKTERQYFDFFGKKDSAVTIRFTNHKNKSSPEHLLKAIKKGISGNKFKHEYEAWCVCDKDKWSDKQLNALATWARSKKNYGFALSNPKFEFWLLLHFEDGSKVRTAADCDSRLETYLPGYDKGIDERNFPINSIRAAVERAKRLDKPRCTSWPKNIRRTTVYRLVEKILAAS